MSKTCALAAKDLRLLLRDKTGFFFVFFFPLLFAIFFGVVFSGEGGNTAAIPLALVDEDSTAGSRAFTEKLSQAPELQVITASREEASSLVQRGKRSAYVVLKKGFGEAWGRIYWGEAAVLEVGVDPSRKAEAGMLQGVLTSYFMQGMQDTFQSPEKMRTQLQTSLGQMQSAPPQDQEILSPLIKSLQEMDKYFAKITADQDSSGGETTAYEGWQPLKMDVRDVAVDWEGPKNPFEITFPQAIIWAMIGCAAAFGISLVTERTRGTLVRLRTAPLGRGRILAGKALACFATNIAVIVLLLAFAMLVFGVRPHAPAFFALAVLCASLCFVGIMMLLSVLGKTEASAGGIGWAVLLVMAMLGGGMVPLFVMPSWLQTMSTLSPVKWAILAMEGAIWRGFTLSQMLLHCGVLLGIGTLCFTIGARIFKWTEQ